MDSSQILEFLQKNVPLFKEFPEEILKQLVEGSKVSSFEPNEAILSFGDEGGRFLGVFLEGRAGVSVTDDSAEKHHINYLRTGDIFGEMSLMTGDKTVADVIAKEFCTTLQIPRTLFGIILTNPGALRLLSKTISERSKMLAVNSSMSELAASALRKSDDPYGFRLKSDNPMKILVINCGSSSLKYNLFDTHIESNNARGCVERIGDPGTRHCCTTVSGEVIRDLPLGGHGEALESVVKELTQGTIRSASEISAVGHRVVHGGEKFSGPVVITPEVLKEIEGMCQLAPLHNPVNITGIKEAMRFFPTVPHIAVFDTAFHHTLPPYAFLYGLPYEYYEKKGIRRYGFHGMSHAYVSLKAAEFLRRPFNELKIITCHLGNGASICAVDHGRSVDTSMGLTPAEGLIMGTRCGSIDPAVLIHLMRTEGATADDLDKLINRSSGLKGLSGVSNDMREIESAAQNGNHRALIAFKSFCYQVRKYIGAYAAAMGGVDILIFTGGIGQGSHGVRGLACQGLGYMGISLDEQRNRTAKGFSEVWDISTQMSPVRTLVVPTDEERMIARESLRAIKSHEATGVIKTQAAEPVPIEVSAHHVHLTQEHVEVLFGKGYQLTKESDLSQPGQFASREKVTLIGPKGRIERVRVLGPVRKETQAEIAMTEQFKLGIQPPIRESGDVKGTPGATFEGPAGSVTTENGVICALRHIHMSPEEALKFGVKDKNMIRVRVPAGRRELIFGDVLVRVHPNFRLAMHIDTDEANAANITNGMVGYLDGVQNANG